MTRRTSTRLLIVVGLIAIVVVAFGLLLDDAAPIDYYRDTGPNEIVVGAESAPSLWSRVTSVVESDTQVVVNVRSVRAPVASAGGVAEFTVELTAPLGTRQVIDGRNHSVVPPR